jgi:hypothetical protein
MLITFGATFAGVFASFFLWFGAERLLKLNREKKAAQHMITEVSQELLFNVKWLRHLRDKTPKSVDEAVNKDTIKLFMPERALTSACRYAVTSGEIRLIPDYNKQQAIRESLEECDLFNKIAEKTDLMVSIFLLRPDGIAHAIERVNAVANSAVQLSNALEENATKLMGKRFVAESLGECKGEDKVAENRSGESQDRLIQRIEEGFKGIKEQIQKSDNDNCSLFVFGFGFAVVTAGLAVGLGFQFIKDQIGMPLSLVLVVMLTIGGGAIMQMSDGMAIIKANYDESRMKLLTRRAKAVRGLLYFGWVVVLIGIAIRQWFALPGNAVGVFGFFMFMLATLIMLYSKKSPDGNTKKSQQNS